MRLKNRTAALAAKVDMGVSMSMDIPVHVSGVDQSKSLAEVSFPWDKSTVTWVPLAALSDGNGGPFKIEQEAA